MDLVEALFYLALGFAVAASLSWVTGKPLRPFARNRAQWAGMILWVLLFTGFYVLRVAFEIQLLIVVAIAAAATIWTRRRRTQAA